MEKLERAPQEIEKTHENKEDVLKITDDKIMAFVLGQALGSLEEVKDKFDRIQERHEVIGNDTKRIIETNIGDTAIRISKLGSEFLGETKDSTGNFQKLDLSTTELQELYLTLRGLLDAKKKLQLKQWDIDKDLLVIELMKPSPAGINILDEVVQLRVAHYSEDGRSLLYGTFRGHRIDLTSKEDGTVEGEVDGKEIDPEDAQLVYKTLSDFVTHRSIAQDTNQEITLRGFQQNPEDENTGRIENVKEAQVWAHIEKPFREQMADPSQWTGEHNQAEDTKDIEKWIEKKARWTMRQLGIMGLLTGVKLDLSELVEESQKRLRRDLNLIKPEYLEKDLLRYRMDNLEAEIFGLLEKIEDRRSIMRAITESIPNPATAEKDGGYLYARKDLESYLAQIHHLHEQAIITLRQLYKRILEKVQKEPSYGTEKYIADIKTRLQQGGPTLKDYIQDNTERWGSKTPNYEYYMNWLKFIESEEGELKDNKIAA